MESNSNVGRQSRLLARLLGKLRGEHRYSTLDKNNSYTSSGMNESVGCGSTAEDEPETVHVDVSSSTINDLQFASNIDMRYGGQYLTPEQLPEFCTQLHHLVEVIRNIQSYAKVTGEYPRELERRLEREAREVCALAGEVRHAREAAARVRQQRRALRPERARLRADLAVLRDAEIRELESSVRTLDRKLFKSWEALRDSNNAAAFEPLLEEVRNKQAGLECLTRLIENRRAQLARAPRALPMAAKEDTILIGGIAKRQEARRGGKRRRREPRSEPASLEASHHSPQQVTLYIQGPDASPLALPAVAGASVQDIMFFSTD